MAPPAPKRKLPPSPSPDDAAAPPPQRKTRPLPPSDLERMRAGIEYAAGRLESRRDTIRPPPNVERLLVLYRGACAEYVARCGGGGVDVVFDEGAERRLCAEVRAMEADGERLGWIGGGAGMRREAEILEADLVMLRRMGYYARYRECAPVALGGLYRAERELREREGWFKVFKEENGMARINRWSGVSADFFNEEVNWARWQKDGVVRGPDGISTHLAVFTGCSTVGVHWKQMQETIHCYGSQDRSFPGRIPDILAQGSIQTIAGTLHRDLKDLASVMPPGMEDEELFIRALILELRDRWFDRRANEDDPATWRASRYLNHVIGVARNMVLVRQQATAEANPRFGGDFLELLKIRHPELVAEQATTRRLQRVEAEAQDNLVRRLEMRGGPGNHGACQAQPKSARQRVWQNIIQQHTRTSSNAQLSLESQRERDQVLLQAQARSDGRR